MYYFCESSYPYRDESSGASLQIGFLYLFYTVTYIQLIINKQYSPSSSTFKVLNKPNKTKNTYIIAS